MGVGDDNAAGREPQAYLRDARQGEATGVKASKGTRVWGQARARSPLGNVVNMMTPMAVVNMTIPMAVVNMTIPMAVVNMTIPMAVVNITIPMAVVNMTTPGQGDLGRGVEPADAVVALALEEVLREVRILEHGQLQGGAAEARVVVCVHRAAHALDHDQVGAQRGLGHLGRHPQQVQAGRALPVGGDVQPAMRRERGWRGVVMSGALRTCCCMY